MTAERWRQIESLFAEAVQRELSEREAFLEQACRGDEELRRELESLLACDAPDQNLAEIPAAFRAGPTEEDDAGSGMTGRRIGPYRVIRLVGRGGMGAVYLGIRDDDQFQKQVAIKLLKRGMDTDYMLSRFRQERQILANLEHPFIARLLDGGATDDGLPYLVMEYVDGVTITDYCKQESLSIPERLRLFRLVCEAVQYAHQNLVIHRDIKPSNILVTKEGIPKLLDFGIAKVLNPGNPADATLTRHELRMLTPDYASPEQAKGSRVSTACDIYSMGAVLYELLTHQLPHKFTSESPTEMERVICDVDPEKPSLAADKSSKRQLTGDLDNIVLTAMRKEPQRRYASAAEFSEDLLRHMDGRPVLARESRWRYRAEKFVRRHRFGVLTAALVLTSLIGGMVATTFQARRAERRFQLVRGLANSMLFDLHDQMERLPGSTALRAATIGTVVKYLDALARDGTEDPSLEVEIAKAYERAGTLEGHPMKANLGHGQSALTNYRKALAIYERLAQRTDSESDVVRGLIETHINVSGMEAFLGNPAMAVSHWQKASAIANDVFARGTPSIPRSTQVRVYFRLADADYDRGVSSEEVANYRKGLEVCQAWASADRSPEALVCLREGHRNVGSALARGGDLFGARESFRRAQEVAEELQRRPDATVEQQYETINVFTSTGDVLAASDDPNLGDRPGALSQYQAALTLAERLSASEPRNMNGRRLLAACNQRLGMLWAEDMPNRALEHFQKALSIAESLGAGDPLNAEYRYHASRAYVGLGEALENLRRHEEALQNLNRSVELQKAIAAVSPERIWNLRVLSRTHRLMGLALLGIGDPDRALNALNEGLAVADRMLERAPSSLYHQLDRAEVLEALGGYYGAMARRPGAGIARRAVWKAEARSHYQKSLAIWQDWSARKLAVPYAKRRLGRVSDALASIERL